MGHWNRAGRMAATGHGPGLPRTCPAAPGLLLARGHPCPMHASHHAILHLHPHGSCRCSAPWCPAEKTVPCHLSSPAAPRLHPPTMHSTQAIALHQMQHRPRSPCCVLAAPCPCLWPLDSCWGSAVQGRGKARLRGGRQRLTIEFHVTTKNQKKAAHVATSVPVSGRPLVTIFFGGPGGNELQLKLLPMRSDQHLPGVYTTTSD